MAPDARPCSCCRQLLTVPAHIARFECAVCHTVTDTETRTVYTAMSRISRQAIAAGNVSVDTVAVVFASPGAVRDGLCADTTPTGFADAAETISAIAQDPALLQAMVDATNKLLKCPGEPLSSERAITFLHVVFEVPFQFPSDQIRDVTRNDMLARIFGLTTSLDRSLHSILITWLEQLPLPSFQRRIDISNKYITHCLTRSSDSRDTYASDWRLSAASRMIALFVTANNSRVDKLPISAFYNTVVDYCDLISDFWKWQEPGHKLFSFCQFPFLISLGSKIRILEIDARSQMVHQFKQSFFAAAFRGVHSDPFISLTVRRTHLIVDSLDQLQKKFGYLKKKLRIEFQNEEGVDAGGLTKEWFLLLVRQLFDPQFGMFAFDEESRLCWFNVASLENVLQFQLVGIVVGLSLYNSTILDMQLPLACFKKLLGVKPDFSDLKMLYPALARGLEHLLSYDSDDVEQVFCRMFVAEYEAFGSRVQVPLIPNGENIPVTNANKKDYVNRLVDWMFNESIVKQFEAFSHGFHQVCGGNALSLFRPEEIELMVRGSTLLDFRGLQFSSTLDGFKPDDSVIIWLWEVLNAFSNDMKRQFLLFATGSDRMPATGAESLQLKISCLGSDCERLPLAHTCFNQLCLYRYSSKETLEHKLTQAMQWSSGFLVK